MNIKFLFDFIDQKIANSNELEKMYRENGLDRDFIEYRRALNEVKDFLNETIRISNGIPANLEPEKTIPFEEVFGKYPDPFEKYGN